VSTYLRRVSERVIEGVLANPGGIRRVLFPSSTETVIDDEVLITIEGLEYLEPALSEDTQITKLGAPVGDIDIGGDGPARGFTPAEVRKLATKLTLFAPDALPKALRQIPLPPESPPVNELVDAYTTMREFVLETAKAEAAIILYRG
jgi:hypothetical protein